MKRLLILNLTLSFFSICSIKDAQGRKVLQTECGQQATISVSSLKNGIYTVIVNNEYMQRFVKE